jgi:O-acetyl-ADP-ribose deacetylase (regulator of RNase III)
MVNQRIEHFSFWQPVIFTRDDNPGTTDQAKWGWVIGSFADQYLSLNQEALKVKAERIDGRKIYFETDTNEKVDLLFTALKVSSYVLSFGILPVIALVVKYIFKNHLNECRALTKKSPNEVFAEKQIGKSKIVLLYGDITQETTDAIVNAANAHLRAGAGVCGAIHNAAGDTPFDECQEILKAQNRRKLGCGEAVLTASGDLAPRIKAIVHTVGPDYRDRKEKENGSELLAAAYRNSLELTQESTTDENFVSSEAQDQVLHSIAFPSISTGIYEAPLDEAAPLAIQTAKEFLEQYPDALEEIRFVFLPLKKDAKTAPAYEKALEDL